MIEVQVINVQDIDRPNPPVRISFVEEEIASLTESIRDKGILVPLLVRRVGERFEVIDGDCRLEAAVRLRLREVPCMVRDSGDSETHVLRLLANLDRSNPDPVSEAVYIAKAIASGAITAEALVQKLNRSPQWIENRLTIAEMPAYMQDALRAKELPLGIALELMEIDEEDYRQSYMEVAIRDGMTVRTARDSVREFFRVKEIRDRAANPAEAPPLPEVPVQIFYSCAACGEPAPDRELRFVRVHQHGCPQPRQPGAG